MRELPRKNPVDQAEPDPPLRFVLDFLGDMGLLAMDGVLRPLLREVELQSQPGVLLVGVVVGVGPDSERQTSTLQFSSFPRPPQY